MGHPISRSVPTGGAPLLADVARSGNGDDQTEVPRKRLNPIKRKQMEDRIHELEEEINRAEAAIAHLEAELQNFVSADQSQRQAHELDLQKASHAGLIAEWEELSGALQACE